MARKRHRVDFAAAADQDLRSIRDYIAQYRPGAAARWLREVRRQVDLLRAEPLLFGLIPEVEEIGLECRQFIQGNYRVIYHVQPDRVLVLRIIHAARRLTRAQLRLESPEEPQT